jgi:hypothetical protein
MVTKRRILYNISTLLYSPQTARTSKRNSVWRAGLSPLGALAPTHPVAQTIVFSGLRAPVINKREEAGCRSQPLFPYFPVTYKKSLGTASYTGVLEAIPLQQLIAIS